MSTKIEQMTNHLDFLGYKTTINQPQNEKEKIFVTAEHAQKNNIVFFEYIPNFVLFKVSLTTDKKLSPEIKTFINDINRVSGISRLYYDVEDSNLILRFEASYIGDYSRELFSQFIDQFINDQLAMNRMEDFSRLFLS